jgi:hypothetical protein
MLRPKYAMPVAAVAKSSAVDGSGVRSPSTPPHVLLAAADQQDVQAMEERVHDLEAGMRLAFESVADLRRHLIEVQGHINTMQIIIAWFGRVYAWMANSARHFPWN